MVTQHAIFPKRRSRSFIQDDYRITPRLSFNLGLRYDVTYPIKDLRNLLANYEPNSATGLVQVGYGINYSLSNQLQQYFPASRFCLGRFWDRQNSSSSSDGHYL